MTKKGVPWAGVALTACFTVVGVFLNLVVPAEAFNIALDLSALGRHRVVDHHRDLPDPAVPLVAEGHSRADCHRVLVPVLVGGWYAVRGRVLAVAKERVGIKDELLAKDARARDEANAKKNDAKSTEDEG